MLDLLRILLHWRRPLLVFTISAAIIAAIVAWSLTPRYYSQASILPPADNNAAFGGLSSIIQQYQIPIPGGINTPFLPTLYASMIRSRKMATQILDEFELRAVLDASTENEAVEALRGRTFLKYTEENILLIGYEDEDAERAAKVVNAYVRHLDEFIQETNSTRAGDTRRFVEGQVARCMGDLEAAEENLKEFQRQHRAIAIDTQTEGALEIAGEIQARILATEMELDLLRQHARPNAYEVQAEQSKLQTLRDSYARMIGGAEEPPGTGADGEANATEALFPAFEQVPDLALQYLRLLREVKVQTTLYTMLLQQLEQARIEEQKNTAVLSVLDWAAPGELPVYPRKLLIVAFAALAGYIWVGLIAVFVEKLRERREDAAEAAKLAALEREWNRMPGWVRSIERLVIK